MRILLGGYARKRLSPCPLVPMKIFLAFTDSKKIVLFIIGSE